MANYDVLKAAIENAVDWDNNNKQIAGNDMLAILLSIVNNTVSVGYLFKGVAVLDTEPGTPDQNVFYIASKTGSYSNFGLSVDSGEILVVFKYNGTWTKETILYGVPIVNELKDGTVIADSYINSSGNIVGNFPSADVEYFNVLAGDEITFVISGATGSSNFAWALYSNTSLSQTTLLQRGPASVNANGTTTLVIPSNCILAVTKLGVATYNITVKRYKSYNSAYEELKGEIIDLQKVELNGYRRPDDIQYNSYVNSQNNIVGNFAAADVQIWRVKKGDSLTLVISNATGSSRAYATYSSETISSANIISAGPLSSSADGTHNITFDQDCYFVLTKLKVANYVLSWDYYVPIDDIIRELYESPGGVVDLPPFLRYNIQNNDVRIAFGYGSKDIIVSLNKHGGNNLFDFASLATIERDGEIGVADETRLLTISTDWHAPFIVAANQNADGDNKTDGVFNRYFTGGNHQYNNTGSGSTPTARTTNIEILIDKNSLVSPIGKAQEIEIRWTNLVQGYNTTKADGSGREILKENHYLTISRTGFNEVVELIPMEDVTIELWYGFQYSGRATIYPNTLFVGGGERGIVLDARPSGAKMTNEVRGFDTTNLIRMFVDNTFDLGTRFAISENSSGAQTGGGNKAYMHVIDNLVALTGNRYWLRGGWIFTTL